LLNPYQQPRRRQRPLIAQKIAYRLRLKKAGGIVRIERTKSVHTGDEFFPEAWLDLFPSNLYNPTSNT